MDIKIRNLVALAFFTLASAAVFAQAVPFEIKKAKVLDFRPPYKTILVDLLDSDDESKFTLQMALDNAQFLDKKGSPVPPEAIRPGAELSMTGEEINYKRQIKTLTLESRYVGDDVELDGVLEHYDPETQVARVDGQKVKLSPGVSIVGDKSPGCKKNCECEQKKMPTVASFEGLNLGRFVTLKGKRLDDGIVHATAVEYCPNALNDTDREFRVALGDDLDESGVTKLTGKQLPAVAGKFGVDALYGGQIKIGDAQFKLVEDLRVQAYVSYIGRKVIPDYMKNIPPDVPDYINFRFYVIENPTFNAFALPNGIICVHTGLLAMIDNEAQLAEVLGHEIAHVTHEHSRQRFETTKKIEFVKDMAESMLDIFEVRLDAPSLFGLIKSGDVRQGLAKVIQATPATQSAVYSMVLASKGNLSNIHAKEREHQSDRVGLFYMVQAGYDPREAAKIWEKFMVKTKDEDFMNSLRQTTKEFAKAKNRFGDQANPLLLLGDVGMSKMVNRMLENMYSSHPKAKDRFRSLNQLVSITYADLDFSTTVTQTEEFLEVQRLVLR